MTLKIGINGFGAIGRRALRYAWDNPEVEIVGCNDLTDPETLAYLLQYDSHYGRFPGQVRVGDGALEIDGRQVRVFSEKDPSRLPWGELGAEIILEATGVFNDADQARAHLEAGAERVLIAAPAKKEDLTVVMGVNEHWYDPEKHRIISNASCTTNCLAPVARVLHENFGIKRGLMTTVHAYTAGQKILDAPAGKLSRGRAAAQNIVPTTTGAAKAVTMVMPELEGKMNGMAMRVPTPVVSIVDLVAEVEKPATVEKINQAMEKAATGELKGILGYEEMPLVSKDFQGDSRSAIFDATQTMVIEDQMVKILAWYDNEWGYACRLVDMAEYIKKKG